jgi:hypothetical protein
VAQKIAKCASPKDVGDDAGEPASKGLANPAHPLDCEVLVNSWRAAFFPINGRMID